MVAIALVLSFLIKTFLFRAFYIPSESMVSTLDVNDRIFVNLLVPEPFALRTGRCCGVQGHQGLAGAGAGEGRRPVHWVGDGLEIRRAAAGQFRAAPGQACHRPPGDHVSCCDAGGKLTINGGRG